MVDNTREMIEKDGTKKVYTPSPDISYKLTFINFVKFLFTFSFFWNNLSKVNLIIPF
jgi:hypothetical protein